MPVLPFHKYLGPGNDLDSGEPFDIDDAIAQEHDSAYETALTAKDISDADERAISEFYNDFSTTGATGLTLKHQLEKRVGILYPDMSDRAHKYSKLALIKQSGRKQELTERQTANRHEEQDAARRDRMQDPGQPATSRDVSDIGQQENNAPISTDAVDSPQGDILPQGGVTNPSNNIATLYLSKSITTPAFTFFKKSRLMHTWGFGSAKFPRGPTGDKNNDYLAYTTSLAYVPVDWIPFYLSPAEFEMLPIGSYIKEVYVEIIPKGVRCSFDTGTSLTGSANSMHVIFGKHCVGLNHKLEMVNMKLKQNDTKPMTINGVEELDQNEFTKRFYGDPDNYHGTDTAVFPTTWGANRSLPYYACIMTSTNKSNKNEYFQRTGWPRTDNLIDRYNLNEHINVPCIQYSYKPRNGMLKNLFHSAVVPNKVRVITGHVPLGVQRSQYIASGAFSQLGLNCYPVKEQLFEYESIVEKNSFMAHGNNLQSVKAQPQIHIGIEPVQANAPTDAAPDFVNASAEYEIKCTCSVGINQNIMYANGPYASKSSFPVGRKEANQHYYISQNHIGGYYSENWGGKYDTKS